MIGHVISWAVFGLIVGAVARLLYPGRQPMSILMTMVLGIVGSMIGGMIAWGLNFGGPDRGMFDGAGWIMSIVGALIVVWVSLYMAAQRGVPANRNMPL